MSPVLPVFSSKRKKHKKTPYNNCFKKITVKYIFSFINMFSCFQIQDPQPPTQTQFY